MNKKYAKKKIALIAERVFIFWKIDGPKEGCTYKNISKILFLKCFQKQIKKNMFKF